ncbi:MAG TPA: acyltransferase family protein [Microbacteriaceae bacterium]|nr:acyltransferase family protein [Microbacteriaceae bacterium]
MTPHSPPSAAPAPARTPAPGAAPRTGGAARFGGLDGLRAVAVILVMTYHLFPPAFAGGFIGVDVFFVISGFLITSLLLRERAATGRISLLGFWQRRARRLLPAVIVMIAVSATAAWLIGGDVLVGIGRQALGALTFTYNWVSIGAGSSYFSADTPELFRNLWSLGIEEQFYLLWPLLFLLLMLVRARWVRIAAVVLAALASAAWMAALVGDGGDPTRAYFGTDAHAFGLLGGVALAFVWQAIPATPPAWMLRPAVRVAVTATGGLAIAALLALAQVPATTTTATFPGALAAASLLSLVVIVAGIWPGAPFGGVLDTPPLRFIGERSYGLYLWHWPLVVLLTVWTTGLSPAVRVPIWVGVATLVLTFAAAEVSYRLIETPIRTLGFRGSFRRWGHRIVESAATRWATLGAAAVFVLLIVGAGSAVVSAPAQTSAQDVVQAGIDALAEAETETDAGPGPTTDPEAGAEAAPSPAPSTPSAPMIDLAPIAPPRIVPGDEITAIGDSVMLAAAPALMQHYPGIQIDAAVSRSMWAGPGIVQALADAGQLRPFVIVALGTNGAIDPGPLAEVRAIAGPDRQVILVNAFAPRSWIEGVNSDLDAFAAQHPHTRVADWSAAIGAQPQLLAGDQIHPGSGGGEVYAQTVGAQLVLAEAERVEEASRPREGAYILERELTFARPQ